MNECIFFPNVEYNARKNINKQYVDYISNSLRKIISYNNKKIRKNNDNNNIYVYKIKIK